MCIRDSFSLGSGAGEFGIPSDIAVDDNGAVYVADNLNQTVRIYNSNGEHTGSIGVPGNEPGQLHNPTSVAIDANGGEIVILDHQQVYDSSSGQMVDGARIQYFAMDGTALRSYSRFGYNNTGTTEIDPVTGIKKAVYDIGMGEMTRPVQLTVDSMSRVYVTDMRMQNVMVYDNRDNFLGAIDYTVCPLTIPQGIAIGSANRLHIASRKSGQIEVIGVDDYTSLLAAPTVVDFRHTETSTAPPSQEAAISNRGKTSFSWTASTPDSWVSLGTASGTLMAAETSSLAVAVVPEGMAPGKYTGSVAINTGAGAAEDIRVVLQVDPNPLQVAPASLSLAAVVGTAPEGQLLAVTSATAEAQSWTASADQPWITLDKTGGTTTDAIRVAADTTSLAAGAYSGVITIVQQSSNPARVEIPVSLTVDPSPLQVAPGSLGFATEVGTTPAGLELSITSGLEGEVSWSASTDQPWLRLSRSNGTAPGSIRAYADIAALSPGSYSGTITVVQQGDGSASVAVPVSLSLTGSSLSDNFPMLGDNGKDQWDKKWFISEYPSDAALNGVAGGSAADVFAVGGNGLILHFDGTEWSEMDSGTVAGLNSVWSVSGDGVYAVGREGLALRYNGAQWIPAASAGENGLEDIWGGAAAMVTAGEFGTILNGSFTSAAELDVALRSVSGSSDSDIYVAGEAGAIFHFDGTAWSAMDSGTTQWLNGIWSGSPSFAVAVGENGAIVRFDGSGWSAMDSGTGQTLNGVCGFSATDLYAVGGGSLILHYDGSGWSGVDAGTGADLHDILCTGAGDIIAVGDNGTIIQAAAKAKGKGKDQGKGKK